MATGEIVQPNNKDMVYGEPSQVWTRRVVTAASVINGRCVVRDTTDGGIKTAPVSSVVTVGFVVRDYTNENSVTTALADRTTAYQVGDYVSVVPFSPGTAGLLSGDRAITQGQRVMCAAAGQVRPFVAASFSADACLGIAQQTIAVAGDIIVQF